MSKLTATVIANGEEYSSKRYDLDDIPNIRKYLDRDKRYSLALDQSTSCTGIYLVSEDDTIKVIMDFERHQEPKMKYTSQLRALISRLVSGLDMEHLLLEEPVRHAQSKYANDVLRELKGALELLKYELLEFDKAKFATVLPNVWRSRIMDKSKGTGRFYNKECVAEDIVDAHPELKNHLARCTSKDLDSFDAVGIYYGYKELTGGGKFLHATKENVKHARVYAFYIEAEYTDVLEDILPPALRKHGVTLYDYNPNVAYRENIRKATMCKELVLYKVEDMNDIINLCFRFDIDFQPNKAMVLCVTKKHDINRDIHDAMCDLNIEDFEDIV